MRKYAGKMQTYPPPKKKKNPHLPWKRENNGHFCRPFWVDLAFLAVFKGLWVLSDLTHLPWKPRKTWACFPSFLNRELFCYTFLGGFAFLAMFKGFWVDSGWVWCFVCVCVCLFFCGGGWGGAGNVRNKTGKYAKFTAANKKTPTEPRPAMGNTNMALLTTSSEPEAYLVAPFWVVWLSWLCSKGFGWFWGGFGALCVCVCVFFFVWGGGASERANKTGNTCKI
jgi:hypothetical protein